jgi:hypothetical protein
MSFMYSMAVDDAYARTFLKRFTQSRFRYHRLVFIAVSLLSLLGSLAFFAVVDPGLLPSLLRTMAVMLLPAVMILAILAPLLRARQVKRIVAAASGGASVTLSDEGISTTSASSQSRTQWSAYDHALRYDDGLMLMRMKNLPILWLPDRSLVDASPDEVTSFVAKILPLSERGRQVAKRASHQI